MTLYHVPIKEFKELLDFLTAQGIPAGRSVLARVQEYATRAHVKRRLEETAQQSGVDASQKAQHQSETIAPGWYRKWVSSWIPPGYQPFCDDEKKG